MFLPNGLQRLSKRIDPSSILHKHLRNFKGLRSPVPSICFLDSSTSSNDDLVAVDSESCGIGVLLKEYLDNRYYHYTDMTVDEVVGLPRMPVIHTTFHDPAPNENTEGRVSFET